MADGKVKIYGGKVLLVGGKVALADDCCCVDCECSTNPPAYSATITTTGTGDCDKGGTYTPTGWGNIPGSRCYWRWGTAPNELIIFYYYATGNVDAGLWFYGGGYNYYASDFLAQLQCVNGSLVGEFDMVGQVTCTGFTAHVVIG